MEVCITIPVHHGAERHLLMTIILRLYVRTHTEDIFKMLSAVRSETDRAGQISATFLPLIIKDRANFL